ncbi:hypothetical protein HMPREF0462_1389 [Helicobacter pylori 83]|uniref:Uncharacterized protein n=1 Tax=Helicobacter pylori 83 TaxID=585538 RepID=F4D3F5_HELPX|nr:hypothetical protein HMPREF0462_1389 [Helicobacter pylori 83]
MIKFLKSACNQLFNALYLFNMALFLLVGVLILFKKFHVYGP